VLGDMTAQHDVERLVTGCRALYHIPPNMSEDEQRMAEVAAAACRATGTPRLVYHSVLHPQIEAMPHHWHKLRAEELLLASGLEVVFCQPAPYMQNLLPYVAAAVTDGADAFPYGAHVILSMVDLVDVGAVAARVVEGAEHVGASYQLCASDVLTQGQAWARLAEALDVPVPFMSIGVAEWRRRAADRLDTRECDWLAAMFAYYEQHGLRGSSLPLQRLLERQPRSFEDFVRAQ
jgi:NAD(P)H dehydrogenase (quinone)